MINVEINNQQTQMSLNLELFDQAIRLVLTNEGISNAEISLAIVSNAAIHQINNRFLQHNYPTDVISFVLEESEDSLEGELVVSAEMAQSQAKNYQHSELEELLLYVIHGTLHLVGYDDTSDELAKKMRAKETEYTEAFSKLTASVASPQVTSSQIASHQDTATRHPFSDHAWKGR